MSSNPFMKFAAHNVSNKGQWMSSKKSAREVNRDRERAAAAMARRKRRKNSDSPTHSRDRGNDSDDSLDGFIAKSDEEIEYASSLDSDEEVVVGRTKKRRNRSVILMDSDDDDESPEIKSKKRRRIQKKKKIEPITIPSEDESNTNPFEISISSDNDSIIKDALTSTIQNDIIYQIDENDSSDIDDIEEKAIELALKRSMKDQSSTTTTTKKKKKDVNKIKNKIKKPKKLQNKKKNSNPNPNPNPSSFQDTSTMAISLSSSDDDDNDNDNDNDNDDEYHASSLQASTILRTANQLSLEVLSRMREWSGSSSTSDSTKGSHIPKGIIVDGALALTTTISGSSCDKQGSQRLLVTKEMIADFCPGLVMGDYQLIGVNWLAMLHGMTYTDEKGGEVSVNGVLADEMGLGKTVQTIVFLAWLKYSQEKTSSEKSCHRPHIIIVPASVLANWEREIKKFCPSMRVIKYHGSQAERQVLQQKLLKHLPPTNDPIDVILTTYSYFSNGDPSDRVFLKKFRFSYMVVDEAHCLKNPKGPRYRNMHRFSTKHRLLLTGTPVQNNPKELINLLCFLMPLFGGDEGDETTAGERMLEHFVENKEGLTREEGYNKLKQLLGPFVLRRRKIDVLHQLLPPKERKVEMVPFSESSRQLYDSILSQHRSSSQKLSKSKSKNIFTSLRKAANHPLLLRTRHNDPEAVQRLTQTLFKSGYFGNDKTLTIKLVENEVEDWCDYDIHCAAHDLIESSPKLRKTLQPFILHEDDLFSSPKFTRLRTLVPELLNNKHRLLIFSQWTKILDLLETLFQAIDISYRRIDGSTDISLRQTLIDEYNQDATIGVFLLSTRAGGMGINLTSADTVIIHDLDFNPFNDLQAEDRCHRIGQKKKVTVIKMVTEDTVDEDIYKMQERKRLMNAAILEENQNESDVLHTTGKKNNTKNNQGIDNQEVHSFVKNAMNRFLEKEKKENATN